MEGALQLHFSCKRMEGRFGATFRHWRAPEGPPTTVPCKYIRDWRAPNHRNKGEAMAHCPPLPPLGAHKEFARNRGPPIRNLGAHKQGLTRHMGPSGQGTVIGFWVGIVNRSEGVRFSHSRHRAGSNGARLSAIQGRRVPVERVRV